MCRNRLTDAEARAEAAELAKIELSLKLAELAAAAELAEAVDVDGRSTARPSRTTSAAQLPGGGEGWEEPVLPLSFPPGGGGGAGAAAAELEALQRRAEAAELAAAAASRRAAAAEAQADKLKVGVPPPPLFLPWQVCTVRQFSNLFWTY